jgi:hypothetical protein
VLHDIDLKISLSPNYLFFEFPERARAQLISVVSTAAAIF